MPGNPGLQDGGACVGPDAAPSRKQKAAPKMFLCFMQPLPGELSSLQVGGRAPDCVYWNNFSLAVWGRASKKKLIIFEL